MIKFMLALALMIPAVGFAETNATEETARSRCSARPIDRFYCPVAGGQWWGPYWDNGCSVKCAEGQNAVCETATCEEGQTGDAVPSSCECK